MLKNKIQFLQSAAREPIRCFDGNARPHEPFWQFRDAAQSDSGQTEVEFYGPISEFVWWGDEITPKLFKDQLYANGKNGPVTVRVNSPGGDLIAASVIRSMLLDYPGTVTVKVEGMAASAAVMVVLGGDRILMQASAYMMIHEAAAGLLGYFQVDELKALIDELKTINAGIVEAYALKTKMEPDQLKKMMADETWMTASEAVSFGFADEVISSSAKTQNKVINYANVLKKNYLHVPATLLNSHPQAQSAMMDMEDIQAACQSALDYCIECLHQCESCPNRADKVHQANMATLRQCIEACSVCMHDCAEPDISIAQLMAACQSCMDSCLACVSACEACAESCQVCTPACTVCKDACQFCSTVCSQQMGEMKTMNLKQTIKKSVNIPRGLLPSEPPQAGINERQAQRLAARAKTFLIKE